MAGKGRHIPAVFLQCLVSALRVLALDALVSPDGLERLHHRVLGQPKTLEDLADLTAIIKNCKQHVLGTQVLVLELQGHFVGCVQLTAQLRRKRTLNVRSIGFGKSVEQAFNLLFHQFVRYAQPLEKRRQQALLLVQ